MDNNEHITGHVITDVPPKSSGEMVVHQGRTRVGRAERAPECDCGKPAMQCEGISALGRPFRAWSCARWICNFLQERRRENDHAP